MSKKDQWRKTVEQQLTIKDSERQSVRRIISRLRGNTPSPDNQIDAEQLIEQKNIETEEVNTPIIKNDENNIPVKNLDRSKDTTSLITRPVNFSTVSESRPVKNLDQHDKKTLGYTKVPNSVFDGLIPSLPPVEALLFLRLYRLSVGFNSVFCIVGTTALSRICNISEQTCRTAIRSLIDKRHVRIVEVINTKDLKGTKYEILTGLEFIPVKNLDRYKDDTGLKSRPITDHDHDDLKHIDHHQREVMKMYESITGNRWKRADSKAYEEIKRIGLETIEQAMRVTKERAMNRPNSLKYFIKEILSVSNPSSQSKTQRKQALAKIVERIRTRLIGVGSYSTSDFIEDCKRECAREGVMWDNDLFNEVAGF